MPILAFKSVDQVFTHVDPDNGQIRAFNASLLRQMFITAIANGFTDIATPFELPLDDDLCTFIYFNRRIEEARVERLTEEDMRMPVFACHMSNDTHLIVDGNHRIIKTYREGKRTIRCAIFEQKVWEKCLVELPKELLDTIVKGMKNEADQKRQKLN